MTSTGKASGTAHDAQVATDEDPDAARNLPAHERGKDARTPAEQDYLDAQADAAEAAVSAVKQQIKDLQASLKDREADAKTARAAARGKVG